MLIDLLKAEEKCKTEVKESEDEVSKHLFSSKISNI